MKYSENLIQQQCVIFFTNTYCLTKHNPRFMILSIPNESENAWETQKKKNTGLLRGASDLIILMPGIMLFMECKTEIGVQSTHQKDFEDRVTALGFTYHIFRSLDQFKSILQPYISSWQKKP